MATLIKADGTVIIDGYNYDQFPIPNDRIDESIVVASVPYIDDERGTTALVLLLNKSAPFFTVAHYYITDMAEEDFGLVVIPFRPKGYLHILGTHHNIVPAVEEYEQSGGDY